jgi:hypothetical protein
MSLLTSVKWETLTSLSSDHLPIIITIPQADALRKQPDKTYINFSKADWKRFKADTELAFNRLPKPSYIITGEILFRKIINQASKVCTMPRQLTLSTVSSHALFLIGAKRSKSNTPHGFTFFPLGCRFV